MLIWPASIIPSFPLDHITEDPTIRTPFEDGSEQTRPRYTRMRESFVLRFKNLPKAKYDLLKEFLAQVKVGSVEFEWTHPDPTVGTVYIVKIVSISPFQFTIYGYSGEITIRGVKKNA